MKNYEKWEKYTIGKVRFIEKTKNNPHRADFVNFVLNNNISSVIELGPGELIEYQSIKQQKPDIQYSIVEVSDLFIKNCKDKFPEVTVIRCPVEETSDVGVNDIVYASSVLEHSRDIKEFIKRAIDLGDMFYFVMFKWSYGGTLESDYNEKKKYWSSSFDIGQLLDEIEKHGKINQTKIAIGEEFVNFDEYSRGKSGHHRTGDYLIIQGESK